MYYSIIFELHRFSRSGLVLALPENIVSQFSDTFLDGEIW